MPDLADELASIPTSRPPRLCGVAWFYQSITATEAAAIDGALLAGKAIGAVYRLLAKHHDIGELSPVQMKRHAQGLKGATSGCRCRPVEP